MKNEFIAPTAPRPPITTNPFASLENRDEPPVDTPIARTAQVWSIVLAGGEGERLRALTERWLGLHRPKQYCTFTGRRSMLQHTLARAAQLSNPRQIYVVAARHHAPEVWAHLEKDHSRRTIFQPRNCGTAPGVFLPLTHIYSQSPESIVVLFPSDHFVFPERTFLGTVRRAVQAAQRQPDKLILMGARPDYPETEFGWIEPGATVDVVDGQAVRRVMAFREKPRLALAQRLFDRGALWNTMVMAFRAQTLWDLGWRCLPEMMSAFDGLRSHFGAESEKEVLQEIYETMPTADFSSHLVEKAVSSILVMELRNVVWSDWGNEARIVETLRRIGKRPSFAATDSPLECSTDDTVSAVEELVL
ncbi:sugar phosphate nucleotidyltransferase [Opitutus terrae]|uniref:Nucleotidyl transferase n=1 Tax=Opitutus terrae (strain DSM 11246 / JCM 15787 / PB90-1) TaxID=452637 RepID=B1ZPT1_OPITP|nr:sugar phosphate nucleotidyltransferase [Opitutus terrae]ACB75534.1 Nucleotidyl transferase [Opitutus terrae PB90-1]